MKRRDLNKRIIGCLAASVGAQNTWGLSSGEKLLEMDFGQAGKFKRNSELARLLVEKKMIGREDLKSFLGEYQDVSNSTTFLDFCRVRIFNDRRSDKVVFCEGWYMSYTEATLHVIGDS